MAIIFLLSRRMLNIHRHGVRQAGGHLSAILKVKKWYIGNDFDYVLGITDSAAFHCTVCETVESFLKITIIIAGV